MASLLCNNAFEPCEPDEQNFDVNEEFYREKTWYEKLGSYIF